MEISDETESFLSVLEINYSILLGEVPCYEIYFLLRRNMISNFKTKF